MKRVLILGGKSCLARQIIKDLRAKKCYDLKIVKRNKINIQKQFNKLTDLIEKFKPKFIINCIALTGLLYCEDKERDAFEVNAYFPTILMDYLKNKKIFFIHFSTEAVFEGNKINKLYKENDTPYPNTVYGKSKLLADLNIKNHKNSIIIRLPMLYGPYHKGQIVDKLMTNLRNNKKVFASSDVYSTPLYSPLLSKFILEKIFKNKSFYTKKILHFTSSKYISIYDFIYILAKELGKEKLVTKVKDNYFGKTKIKPKYLGLKSTFKYCNEKLITKEFVKNYE